MAEPFDRSIRTDSTISSLDTGEGIIIDLGTGDGHFVYHCAHLNPKKFYIGIDAHARPLEKISEKIHRKPAKGGLPNVLFLQASVENLPSELDGVANEVHVHFPWGSLLGAIVSGDQLVMGNLRRICLNGALLEVLIGLDEERDRSEIKRLGLEPISDSYITSVLLSRYRDAGFEILEHGTIPPNEWPRLHSSWATRLKDGIERELTYIIAKAV